ncbi:MAG TPA: heme-binding protein [Gemmatimonadales bacterium]|nr:heme-binding protein [Gemmatimonadales bacterium]
MRQTLTVAAVLVTWLALPRHAGAQASPPPPALTLAAATRIAEAAQAEATRNQWNVVIAILDAGAHLVHLRRMDGTQLGSVDVAQEKAKSAVLFRRPTKAFADAVTAGRIGVLRLPGAMPIEGGIPLLVGDQVVGAIGVSGVTSEQDGQVAQAGARAFSAAR